ncbi:hypothetical protein LUZ63_001719 [Rhynchospora breviuscula]|uniref:Serine incorporator n=1 Tax=Rhynchospora breviuscula TaxID=2022672 RepID=A0A9Q0HXV4_9POAL|nr:hypothetical protein LUZ63_001719 [Rhynchospora breviuscula]
MRLSSETSQDSGAEYYARNGTITKLEELNVIKQSDDMHVQGKQSLRARYIYGFIFFATNLVAWFFRDYGAKFLHPLHNLRACKTDQDECFHAGGVLRVSLGCFIFFVIMFATTSGARKLHEFQNTWHSRWWILKLVLYFASLIVPFIIPKSFVLLYGDVARIGAGIFLLLQLISMLEFIAWCNSNWMPHPQSKKCGFSGLILATISFIASYGGIIMMYASNSTCIFNIFTITWTAILVKVMMGVSLHSKVNEGLLSSGIMGSYIVFLCWSAIQSEPQTGKCQEHWRSNKDSDWSTIVGFLIAICSIVMATFSTGIDTRSFQFRKDQLQLEDDIPYNYGIFHFVFAMGSMYFAMLFISWDLNHPTREWSMDVGWASTWIKIINEWFAASIYLWKLLSPVMSKKVEDGEVSAQHIPPSV